MTHSSNTLQPTKTQGFTLVELSIVLVILGLLVGGVLSGQSLIRAAELRSSVEDLRRFHSSMYTFRDKYFALPGDMKNATRFWGVISSAGDGTGNDAACQNTASTGKPTCNGNGDGFIEHNSVDFGERFRAWHHLSNAGLIEGTYTGTAVTGAPSQVSAGINVPKGRRANSAYIVGHRPASTNDVNWFDASNSYTHLMAGGDFKPEEVWNIDTKLDDGNPVNGKINNLKKDSDWAKGCTTTNDSTAIYDVQNSAARCPVYYQFQ